MKNKKILIISPEPWGVNYVSKHHYANYLSENNTVYFLNPPTSYSKKPFGGIKCKVNKIKDRLYSVDYLNLYPKLNAFPKSFQKNNYQKQANQIHKALAVKEFDIVWSFHPFRFFDQSVWNTKKRIYHTVDIHYEKCYQNDICHSSDLVLLSSNELKFQLPKHQNMHRIGHGTDNQSNLEYTKEFEGQNKLKAAFVGNFSKYIDFDLIRNIALKNTHIDFIFAGPTGASNLVEQEGKHQTNIRDLSRLPNLFFVGEVHAHQLNSFLEKATINLVLYRESLVVVNPHKLLGYLNSGNTTISTLISDYKDANQELVFIEKENANIPQRIYEVSNNLAHWNQESFQLLRRDFAEKNSYSNKIKEIEALLNN